MTRYGMRWRELWWKKRLAQQGRARRQRIARENEERARRSRENSITSTLEGFQRTLSSSRQLSAESPTAAVFDKENLPPPGASLPPVENGFGASTISIPPAPQDLPYSHNRGHRRSESDPDQSLANTVRSQSSRRHYRSSLLRHSFLPGEIVGDFKSSNNISLAGDTTRSTYFKMKAMGLNPAHAPSTPGRKRPRSSEFEPSSASSPFKKPTLADAPSRATGLETTTSKPKGPSYDEDDDLFASVRQVREAMGESISFFKDQLAKDNELKQSAARGSSISPTSDYSVSLLGTSNPVPTSATKQAPPSYRNRVSKFLPRDRYADVLLAERKDFGERNKYVPRRFQPVQSTTSPPFASSLNLENERNVGLPSVEDDFAKKLQETPHNQGTADHFTQTSDRTIDPALFAPDDKIGSNIQAPYADETLQLLQPTGFSQTLDHSQDSMFTTESPNFGNHINGFGSATQSSSTFGTSSFVPANSSKPSSDIHTFGATSQSKGSGKSSFDFGAFTQQHGSSGFHGFGHNESNGAGEHVSDSFKVSDSATRSSPQAAKGPSTSTAASESRTHVIDLAVEDDDESEHQQRRNGQASQALSLPRTLSQATPSPPPVRRNSRPAGHNQFASSNHFALLSNLDEEDDSRSESEAETEHGVKSNGGLKRKTRDEDEDEESETEPPPGFKIRKSTHPAEDEDSSDTLSEDYDEDENDKRDAGRRRDGQALGFDDGLEYESEDEEDDMESDGQNEEEEDEDGEEEDSEDVSMTDEDGPPQHVQSRPSKGKVLINGKSGASVEDAIEL